MLGCFIACQNTSKQIIWSLCLARERVERLFCLKKKSDPLQTVSALDVLTT